MTTTTAALLYVLDILVICELIHYFKIDEYVLIPGMMRFTRRLDEITIFLESMDPNKICEVCGTGPKDSNIDEYQGHRICSSTHCREVAEILWGSE